MLRMANGHDADGRSDDGLVADWCNADCYNRCLLITVMLIVMVLKGRRANYRCSLP